MPNKTWENWAAVVAIATVSACGGVTAGTECAADTDCKGDRVCNAGQCMAPDAGEPPDATKGPPQEDGRVLDDRGSTDDIASRDVTVSTDSGSPSFGDAYAPLPPQPGDAGFTATYSPSEGIIYRPLFSEPSCAVFPPYGEFYAIQFNPSKAGPNGTFVECGGGTPKPPCCWPNLGSMAMGSGWMNQAVDGGMYTLSDFDTAGIATGKIDTAQGIVPLVVKKCP